MFLISGFLGLSGAKSRPSLSVPKRDFSRHQRDSNSRTHSVRAGCLCKISEQDFARN
jgi:hypothetical protein